MDSDRHLEFVGYFVVGVRGGVGAMPCSPGGIGVGIDYLGQRAMHALTFFGGRAR
jgi:tartrate dehydratase alpha subunit/fumarate hydratase class I-like protein